MNVILLQGGESVGELDLSKGSYTVGRGDECSVVVDDQSLAETHAQVLEDGGVVYVESVEGETQVNGVTISGRTALTDSDQLSFGSIELSISIPVMPPPPPVTEPDEPAADTANPAEPPREKASSRIGKGLLGMAKASAREAGRGAKLASLKAQIEKQRRVDLHAAYLALGRKAYELGVMSDELSSEYDQVRAIEVEIAEKRQGVTADAGASGMDKTKAKTLTAKMRAKAELQSRKKNSMLSEIGEKVAETKPDHADLNSDLGSVSDVLQRIQKLEMQYKTAVGDRSARDGLASSVRSICAARPPNKVPSSGTGTSTSPRRSRLAVASCIVGAISLPLLFAQPLGVLMGMAALGLGAVGLAQIGQRRGSIKGTGLGVAGVVIGGLVLNLSLLGAIFSVDEESAALAEAPTSERSNERLADTSQRDQTMAWLQLISAFQRQQPSTPPRGSLMDAVDRVDYAGDGSSRLSNYLHEQNRMRQQHASQQAALGARGGVDYQRGIQRQALAAEIRALESEIRGLNTRQAYGDLNARQQMAVKSNLLEVKKRQLRELR